MNFCWTLRHRLALMLCIMIASSGWLDESHARAEKDHVGDTATADKVSRWVEQLADDSYHVRDQAKRRLLQLGNHPHVTAALAAATDDPVVEVRTAARRLLDELSLRRFDVNLARLNSTATTPDAVDLPGWKQFASIAGDDLQARRMFSRIAEQHHDLLGVIDAWNRPAEKQSRKTVDAVLGCLDPYRLASEDTELWALLFCVDSPNVKHSMANLSTRVCTALSHSGLGPKLVAGTDDAVVLNRMISHWLRVHSHAGTSRDRMLIAMRYRCTDRANEICGQTLADVVASPAEQAMAMLCASVLDRQDLEQQLIARIHDPRTAHVWQLIASRRKKIRTQVRDVAMALLLHHRGIDPRQIGFDELQADPLLVFRDHSLGFADDESRRRAYVAADAALAAATAEAAP